MKNIKFSILLLVLLSLIFSGCTNGISVSNENSTESNKLVVHYIDVGQGDCELIQINNKNLLIDAGTTESTNTVIDYLKKQGITKLDYVIATHPHEDHIGGMAKVIKTFDIGSFYAPAITTNTKTFENMVSALKKKNMKIQTAKSDVSLDLGINTECKFLAPVSKKYADNDLNLYSAVVKITYGTTKFLFTGDAQKLNEKEMTDKNFDVSADVLKVGHHGSHTSTSTEFLNKVSPKIAIISCGVNNDYGHPHKETLDSLKKAKCTIYRTDKDGTIIIESDGKNIVKK
ncbi:MAG: ComEC/Rec2 family competence protein [Bacillota bacterium]|nr:ComEC/Rec2 family competence protein [Bacillota bacterium]